MHQVVEPIHSQLGRLLAESATLSPMWQPTDESKAVRWTVARWRWAAPARDAVALLRPRQNLPLVQAHAIGILCNLRSSYSRQVVMAAAAELRRAGFHPLIEPLLGEDLLGNPAKWRVEGYLGFFEPADYAPLQATGRPAINVSSEHGQSPFPSVLPDSETVGRLAAQHLLERGFNQIAFVPHNAGPACLACGAAAEQTVRRAGAWFEQLPPARESWQACLAKLSRPLGIIGSDDAVAAELLQLICASGLRVPDQVAVVGIGDDEIACAAAVMPLSSVDLNPAQIGCQAAAALVGSIRAQSLPPPLVRMGPHGVVVRASSDTFATNDKLLANIIQFARTHLHEGVGVAAIAKHSGMSRRHLVRIFRERSNTTPQAMLQHLAVVQAKHLLANSELSIAQVAARCGYDNLSHFGTLFRKLTGTTPAVFRHQYH